MSTREVSNADAQLQLKRVLASDTFSGCPRLCRFLAYCVQTTLRGDKDQLTQFAVAFEVFDKPDSFDPAIDPIVRVEAGRLRRLLEVYYATEGRGDPIRINMAKRGYAVSFAPNEAAAVAPKMDPPMLPLPAPPQNHGSGAITVAVLPFEDLSPQRDEEDLCRGLRVELTTSLTELEWLRVVSRAAVSHNRSYDFREVAQELGAQAVVEGSVRKHDTTLRVAAELSDAAQGYLLWAGSHTWYNANPLQIQQEMSQTILDAVRAVFPQRVARTTGV